MRTYRVEYHTMDDFPLRVKRFSSFAKAAHSIPKGVSFQMFEERVIDRSEDIAHYLENPRFAEVFHVVVTGTMLPSHGRSSIVVKEVIRGPMFEKLIREKILVPTQIHLIKFKDIEISHYKVYDYLDRYENRIRYCSMKCSHCVSARSEDSKYMLCTKHKRIITDCPGTKFKIRAPEWCE